MKKLSLILSFSIFSSQSAMHAIDLNAAGKTTLLALSAPLGYALGTMYTSANPKKKAFLNKIGLIIYGAETILLAHEAVTTSDKAEAMLCSIFTGLFGIVTSVLAEKIYYGCEEENYSRAVGTHALAFNLTECDSIAIDTDPLINNAEGFSATCIGNIELASDEKSEQ